MRYRTIVADPPWIMPSGGPYRQGGVTTRFAAKPSLLPYPTMTLSAIESLPVTELADDDAHLYIWVPNAHIPSAYVVADAWGFKPSTMLVWTKKPRGLGLGGAFTITTEYVLFCRRGTLAATTRLDTTWFDWKRPHNAHSKKPEAFLDMVEAISPGPYVELFARRARFGWDYWGDQSLGTAEMAS